MILWWLRTVTTDAALDRRRPILMSARILPAAVFLTLKSPVSTCGAEKSEARLPAYRLARTVAIARGVARPPFNRPCRQNWNDGREAEFNDWPAEVAYRSRRWRRGRSCQGQSCIFNHGSKSRPPRRGAGLETTRSDAADGTNAELARRATIEGIKHEPTLGRLKLEGGNDD
jgi:hypothetical protein